MWVDTTDHFAGLMKLCYIKHTALSEQHQIAKGRVVFRGDSVLYQEGYLAAFSEESTSATHMAAAIFLMLSPDSLIMMARNQMRLPLTRSLS